MGGSVTPITSRSHFKEIVDSGKAVVFDFWATWCGPCRAISPVFEKLSSEYEGLEFYKVDIDDLMDVAEEAGVRVVPTFVLFKDKVQVDSFAGASPSGLQALLAKAS